MSKTDQIFQVSAPYKNPYQGKATRLLFVCSVGLLRSPTAAMVATKMGFNARSCGSEIDCALIPLSANLLNWADEVIFINRNNYEDALFFFKDQPECLDLIKENSTIWEIEDSYDYADPRLIKEIEAHLNQPMYLNANRISV